MKFYITTTLPYVNADPHIGFALEIVQADAIARYQRMLGNDVFFNTGTDEHGIKNYRKATELGLEPQTYVDQRSASFDKLKAVYNLSYDKFIRTTEEHHKQAAQELWKRCEANGDIYKKNYEVKYCVGCELEKTDSELENGKCPLHPNLELESIKEENYFFKFSNYQEKLLKLYEDNSDFIKPDWRQKEMKNFVEKGLDDFSISRLKEKLPWGVEVPGDSDQVMYVWFDALTNYISTLGWPEDEKNFNLFWPGIQVAGKDNLRQQCAIWQAMLMSAGLPATKQIFIHGFINVAGQKMSKSLGNVVNPFEIVEKYGSEAVRYYLLRYVHPFQDSDFSFEHFEEVYTSDLANGLGNLISRISGLIEQNTLTVSYGEATVPLEFTKAMENYRFDEALKLIWDKVSQTDLAISNGKPWELAKSGKTNEVSELLNQSVATLGEISLLLQPFMPKTAGTIEKIFKAGKIIKGEPIFPRLN